MTLTELARPLTAEEEARWRAYIEAAVREANPVKGGLFDMSARLFATLDALRATPVADTAGIDADIERLKEVPTVKALTRRLGKFNDAWWQRFADELRVATTSSSVNVAGPGEYPTPETEQGRQLSSRLRNQGLDFDRSIWNVEQEALAAALRTPKPEEDPE